MKSSNQDLKIAKPCLNLGNADSWKLVFTLVFCCFYSQTLPIKPGTDRRVWKISCWMPQMQTCSIEYGHGNNSFTELKSLGFDIMLKRWSVWSFSSHHFISMALARGRFGYDVHNNHSNLTLNLAISNSVNSKSQLFRSQADCRLFDHHWVLTQLFRNPAISNYFSCPMRLQNSEVRLYTVVLALLRLLVPKPSQGQAVYDLAWIS